MLVATTLLAALVFQGSARPIPESPPPPPRRATAVRAPAAPVIDGTPNDAIWASAAPITEFLEFQPNEGKAPRFATEARVAYDQHNFYVFVRMFDPESDQIKTTLARRDVRPPTDQIKIILDPYFDKRSGYEFAVSPGGVKRDYVIYNDNEEDGAWDGVWDAATTVDSLGWTAEFRIPLSQLRFSNADEHTFGFAIWRDIERYKERVSWPLYQRNNAGLVSQIGEVGGITGLSSPRRLELAPYAVTKNVTVATADGYGHEQQLTGGADFKYGVTSNVTLDGTINPDFGQVEADPAVLNLSAFETFFQERRPFFLEGVGLFRFEVNCYAVNDCGRENLFYSRRIGRSPQLNGFYGDATSSASTTILGAAKLTGRLPGGLSVGVLDAVTQRETGLEDRTTEPTSNYGVLRATRDFRGGETVLGAIGTMVSRANDEWTESYLRSSAFTGGLDLRHRFLNRRYQVQARLVGSQVSGSAEAIAATQQSTVHLYQRPDGALEYDPTRTSLGGDFEQVTFGKVGGGMLRFETSYQRTSPGFEINDLGFLNRADKQTQATWASLQFNKPTKLYRMAFWNVNQENQWTTAGLPLGRMVNTNLHAELPNSWFVHAGVTWGGLGEVYCDRCARGGPALRTDQVVSTWGGIQGDDRHLFAPGIWLNYSRGDGGRSRNVSVSPELGIRVSSQMVFHLGADIGKNRDDRQWYGNFPDAGGATHYTFAHLEQTTTALTTRLDFTATPTLTLQLYAQPFVSKGTYTNLRELNDPRAAEYDQRFQPFTAVEPEGFDVKEFRSNVVLRWEYRTGSALYLVWQQGRSAYGTQAGSQSWGNDVGDLFRIHPDNTFLIKMSYWFDR
ncbi:MAG: hypothetical protein H6R40_508 [Gemmatimonadetes bacterium]|nr:hypothetical protein [Gemmatimonadota bacterium]